MPIRVLCSPESDDIEKYYEDTFSLEHKVLHIVPTMILFRRRFGFFLRLLRQFLNQEILLSKNIKQIEKELQGKYKLFQIDKFIKNLVYQNTAHVLSKSESTILLERIINSDERTNNLSWKSVIPELVDFFSDLNTTGLSFEILSNIKQGSQWDLLLDIYKKYNIALNENNKLDIGSAANFSLKKFNVSEFDELILDGAFLPITYRHEALINLFLSQNKQVTFIIPFDLEQPDQPAQEAIKKIYLNYLPIDRWESKQNTLRAKPNFIQKVPKLLFKNQDKPIHLDNSLEILKFTTFEEELTYIIQKISVLVKRKKVDPRQIVIITPNAMQLRPLVKEISEQHGLKVELPERPLIQLLQGRAIKSLYDIHVDIRKKVDTFFDVAMLKIFLQDSILKISNELFSNFEKIESFFTDCFSIDEWKSKIDELIISKELLDPTKFIHHPLTSICKEQLVQLQALITEIQLISSELVNRNDGTIREHVSHLLNFLKNDSRIKPIHDDVMERLSSIGEGLETQERIIVSGLEFGSRISALLTEQEEYEPGDISQNYEESTDEYFIHRGILVTGPNNVEFQKYQYVFVCHFTQDLYPESKNYNWLQTKEFEKEIFNLTTRTKFNTIKSLDEFYQDRSLYHIMLPFWSTGIQLTISFPEYDEGMALSPAHYLHDLCKVFGIEESNGLDNKQTDNLEVLLGKAGILKSPSFETSTEEIPNVELNPRTIDTYTFSLEDVMIYKYCPRRFYYVKKYNSENIYHDLFHLQAYASSCLYEKSIENLVKSYPDIMHENLDKKTIQNKLYSDIPKIRAKSELDIRPLFPLSLRIWHNVQSQTDFFIRSLITNIFENGFVSEYRKSGNSNLSIQMFMNMNPKEVVLENGATFVAHKELEVQYNKGRIHRYSISNRKDFLFLTSNDYDEKENMDTIKKWYFDFSRQFYSNDKYAMQFLDTFVENIKSGKFDKNVGGHCKYCTFNKQCQEREVDI